MPQTKPTKSASSTDEMLMVLIAMAGRVAFPPSHLREIVSPSGSPKYVNAYNLCDGSRTIADVARLTGLDKSNLGKAVTRWVDVGIMYKVGEDSNPMRIYRLSGVIRETNPSIDDPEDEGRAAPATSKHRPMRRKRVSKEITAAYEPDASDTTRSEESDVTLRKTFEGNDDGQAERLA